MSVDAAEETHNQHDASAIDTSLAELVIREETAASPAVPVGAAAAAAAGVAAEVNPSDDNKTQRADPGPWFDNSPYDTKTPVREVGTMLRAFEDIMWNHGADLNAVESLALMDVVHRMRTAVTELETEILRPRFAQQKCMPSLGLATGMKECFGRLQFLHKRLQATPGAAAGTQIVENAGNAFSGIMKRQETQTAAAVGINLAQEKAAAAATTAATTTRRKETRRKKRSGRTLK